MTPTPRPPAAGAAAGAHADDDTRGGIVGRGRELGALRDVLEKKRGRIALLTGEPGIGKTTLADAAADVAASLGYTVSWGRCWEAGGAPAYWPWTQALEPLTAGDEGDEGDDHRDGDADLAEARRARDALLAAGFVDAASARFAAGRALTAWVAALARKTRGPLLLVLDDLHAADRASLSALVFLARELRALPVVVIGTYRDVEARLSPDAGALIAAAAREALVLSLARLDEAASHEIVKRAAGDLVSPAVGAAIFRATQGNPLFLDEVARLVAQQSSNDGAAAPDALGADSVPLPFGVREAIRQRLSLVDDATRAVLEAAAIAGDELRLDVVAAVAAVPLDDARDAVRRAADAGLLKDDERRFAHALIREVLERDLSRARRAALHERAADALARIASTAPSLAAAEVVLHLLAAGPEHAHAAVDALERGTAHLVARGAYDDAVALVERARDTLALYADPALACRLQVALGDALVRAGRVAEGKAVSAKAAAAAELLADDDGGHVLLARAALAHGAAWTFGLVDPELVSLLSRARARLAAHEPAHEATRAGLLARVEARLAGALQPADDPFVPIALARAAIARARATGDDDVILDTLYAGMSALMDYVDASERAPLNDETRRRAEAAGDRGKALRARVRLAFDRAECGDLAGLADAADDYARAAADIGHPQHTIIAPMLRAMLAFARGEREQHAACVAEARAIAAAAGPDMRVGELLLIAHGMLVAVHDKDLVQLRALRAPFASFLAQGAADNAAGFGAWIAMALGDVDTATREIARFVDHDDVSGRDPALLALVIEPFSACASAAQRTRLLTSTYRALLPRAGNFVSMGVVACTLLGPYDLYLGEIAAALDRKDDARRHWLAARELCERTGARAWLPRLDAHLGASAPEAPETPAPAPAAEQPFSLARDGDVWVITGPGGSFRLKDSRGLQILKQLVDAPNREIHALDLVSPGGGAVDGGDAGALLDDDAKRAYRERLRELEEELDLARDRNDLGRAERLLAEKEAIARELSRGLGLGGRARTAGSAAERARVAVQRRVKDAVEKIGERDPALGAHLEWAVRTGATCVYRVRPR